MLISWKNWYSHGLLLHLPHTIKFKPLWTKPRPLFPSFSCRMACAWPLVSGDRENWFLSRSGGEGLTLRKWAEVRIVAFVTGRGCSPESYHPSRVYMRTDRVSFPSFAVVQYRLVFSFDIDISSRLDGLLLSGSSSCGVEFSWNSTGVAAKSPWYHFGHREHL